MEIYKDIEGYEGYYQVSNLGNVRSIDRCVNVERSGQMYLVKYKGKKITPSESRGYYHVNLCRDGAMRSHSISRLVATAFIPNPHDLPVVNHKDEDRKNNRSDNLEWCTYEYNNNYGNVKKKQRKSQINNPLKSKVTRQYSRDFRFIREYPSLREASRNTCVSVADIQKCCAGKRKTAGNFIWEYGTDSDDKDI